MERENIDASGPTGWGPFRFISDRIQNKILVAFLALAIIPLLALVVIAYFTSTDALMKRSYTSLEGVRSMKANIIQDYFFERQTDLAAVTDAVRTLRQQAADKLTTVMNIKKERIERYFNERAANLSILAANPAVINAMAAFENAPGAAGGEEWQKAARVHGGFFKKVREISGHRDILLASSGGKILFSVDQASDPGKNLKTGALKESPAGRAFTRGLAGVVIEDFGKRADGEMSAFIAAPVKAADRTLGVVMAEISIDRIDAIMADRKGLGETDETYLVGKKGETIVYRSNRAGEKGNLGDPVLDEWIQKALSGQTGSDFTIGSDETHQFVHYAPLDIFGGLQWAIVTTGGVEEHLSPLRPGEELDFLSLYREEYGYSNVHLIDVAGHIFYSVEGKEHSHADLLGGPHRDSNLGRLVARVISSRAHGMADYEKYAPAGDEPAAFMAEPVIIDGDVKLIVVVQLSLDQINAIMLARTGMGETGESYLVGPDKLWRNDSRYLKELKTGSTVINDAFVLDSEAARGALKGETGADIIDNYRGVSTLASWQPVTLIDPTPANPEGVQWGLITEITEEEVRRPVVRLAEISAILLVGAVVLVMIVSFLLSGGLTAQVRKIQDLFSDIGIGDFSARAKVVSSDELGDMAVSLNAMLDNTLVLIQSREERDAIQDAIMRLLEEISGLTEGNLTARADVTEDVTGAIADSFNTMAEQLSRIVRNVKDATRRVGSISSEVSDSTRGLAETSQTQSEQVAGAITTINEMAESIRRVAENAVQSAAVSQRSTENAREGAAAVEKTNASMDEIRERVQETARAIKRLGESSQEIGNIVQIINDIADRTSILALNASIQAAMAGDAGRGFAVVAEEVQRLAERSTSSTKQIETLVKTIQGDINEAGSSMNESIQRVVEGTRLAGDAHDKLQEIETVSADLAELIQSISQAAREQTVTSENISKTMGEVGEVSDRTSEASRQTAQSMREMAETADHLRVSVEVFTLEEEEGDAGAPGNPEAA